MNNNWKKIKLDPDNNIKEAISVLENESLRIVLVADSNDKLLGTVTDGDIRRALVNEHTFETCLKDIMFKNPTYASANDSKDFILSVMKSKDLMQIPILDSNNIIIGLETIQHILDSKKFSNPVLLMVGGLGKRLLPLTQNTPKPLLNLGGKPIIENILLHLINSGFSNFYFSTHYQANKFEEYFKDGSDWGVSIKYLHEDEPLGTAGALGLLPSDLKLPLLVLNGDILTKVNYENLLRYHEQNEADATICVKKEEFEIPYGVVSSKENFVSSIEEKPLKTFFVNAGIYVINPSLLTNIETNKYIDMPTFLNKLIANESKISMFPVHEYWLDIGHHKNLKKAEKDSEILFGND
jgi:dTDP-glucose pyrophosphorylase|tara:strand:+ start:5222 stop:6280 length:1059 start_codon:yes stop_codon:yes gene_type:complete